jgi:hypothetical protein
MLSLKSNLINTMDTKEKQDQHEGNRKYGRVPQYCNGAGQSTVLELPSFPRRVWTHFVFLRVPSNSFVPFVLKIFVP